MTTWHARVDSVQSSGETAEVAVTMWCESDKFSQLFHATSLDALCPMVRAATQSRATNVARKSEIESGMMLDLAPDVVDDPPAPSKEDEARASFAADLAAARRQARFDALPEELKVRCLDAFRDLV